jgi:hypothetical protein
MTEPPSPVAAPSPPGEPLPALDEVLARLRLLPAGDCLQAVRSDQAARWRAGQGIPVETYLERLPALAGCPEDVQVLICGEAMLRGEWGVLGPDASCWPASRAAETLQGLPAWFRILAAEGSKPEGGVADLHSILHRNRKPLLPRFEPGRIAFWCKVSVWLQRGWAETLQPISPRQTAITVAWRRRWLRTCQDTPGHGWSSICSPPPEGLHMAG